MPTDRTHRLIRKAEGSDLPAIMEVLDADAYDNQ